MSKLEDGFGLSDVFKPVEGMVLVAKRHHVAGATSGVSFEITKGDTCVIRDVEWAGRAPMRSTVRLTAEYEFSGVTFFIAWNEEVFNNYEPIMDVAKSVNKSAKHKPKPGAVWS